MTYRPRLSRPTLIVRARTQTLRLEVWDDSALAEPSAGTVTITDASGAEVVSAASVTIVSGVATYSLAAATIPVTLSLSDAWTVAWDLTLSGVAERFTSPAALVRSGWAETLTPGDLIARHPEIAPAREIDPQQEGGATTLGSWIEEAGTELFTRLWTDGKKPWLILDPWAARRYLLPQALCIGMRWASTFMEQRGALVMLAAAYEEAAEKAYDALQFRYDHGETGALADAVRIGAADMAVLGAGRAR